MKIQLTCKLYDGDARYFIDPILNIEELDLLTLYRDKDLEENTKLINVKNKQKLPKFLILIVRFLKMLSAISRTSVIVGIYEIPHGLLALLCGAIGNKPVVISIIGNPKFAIRNQGIRGWVTRMMYKHANVITVTGSNAKVFLVEEKGVKEEKVVILPNSIPCKDFKKLDVDKQYDLITLGRLSHEKGLFTLLEIVKNLKYEFPTIKLGIAGKGPLLEELKKKVIELELENNIDLLGYVDDLAMFLNSGKIFMTTSETEGLPRTVIQSMSCGTPAIASNVGDMSDLVIEGVTGYLVKDFSDIETFSNKIKILLLNEKKRLLFSSRSIQFAKDEYDHVCATKTWKSIFKQLKLI